MGIEAKVFDKKKNTFYLPYNHWWNKCRRGYLLQFQLWKDLYRLQLFVVINIFITWKCVFWRPSRPLNYFLFHLFSWQCLYDRKGRGYPRQAAWLSRLYPGSPMCHQLIPDHQWYEKCDGGSDIEKVIIINNTIGRTRSHDWWHIILQYIQ